MVRNSDKVSNKTSIETQPEIKSVGAGDLENIQGVLDELRLPVKIKRTKPAPPLERYKRSTTETWLNLFTAKETDKSHTIELADNLPLFFYGRHQPDPAIKAIEREFVHLKNHYKIAIIPALLKDPGAASDPNAKGDWKRRFPGEREELVLEVVKYLASQTPLVLDGDLGVPFTIAEIQRILASANHSMRHEQIKDALWTLNLCKFIVTDLAGKNVIGESPIKSLAVSERGFKTVGVLQLSSFHTKAVKKGEYRGLNFPVAIGYQSILARCLHKHIGHYHLNADEKHPFKCLASEVMCLAAFSLEDKPSKWIKRIDVAVNEIREAGYIKEFSKSPMKEGGKIKDYLYTIQLSRKFIDEIIIANGRQKRIKGQLVYGLSVAE